MNVKNGFLLIAALLVFSFSGAGQTYSYDSSITFKIVKVSKWNKINTGTELIVPEKNYKIFMVVIKIENHSSEKQVVDFNDFYLLDYMMSLKYPIKYVMSIGGVTKFHDIQKKISKKSKDKLNLVYVCPEHFTPEFLLVNDQKITIDQKLLNF